MTLSRMLTIDYFQTKPSYRIVGKAVHESMRRLFVCMDWREATTAIFLFLYNKSFQLIQ